MTMPKLKNVRSRGFTIIELLIATVVFSVILVVILAAFVQISRLYYKGVNMSNTQDDTRTALNDIAADIQFASTNNLSAPVSSSSAPIGSFCVGNHRYSYFTGNQVGGSATFAGIYRENIGASCAPLCLPATVRGCQNVTPGTADQLLGNGMQLNSLAVSCAGTNCQLQAHVVFYGGDPTGLFASARYSSTFATNLWQAPDAECTGSLTSSQYCATADYSSTVLQNI